MEMLRSKITTTEFVIQRAQQVRSVTKTVVLCYGNFDLYHVGHVDLLEKAKTCGDMLVVVIDSSVDESKNIFTKEDRMMMLASNECVDYVVYDSPEGVIKGMEPEVVVGSYKGNDPNHVNKPPEAKIVEEYGGKMVLMPRQHNISKDSICQALMVQSNIMGLTPRRI